MADKDLQIKVVTTADTTGLKQTQAEMEKIRLEQERQNKGAAALFAKVPPGGPPKPPVKPEEDEALAQHIGRGLERAAIHAIGVGAVIELINEIKKAAEEINKITESLDKQGEQLVKNVQLMAEASKFAQTEADIVKIGESGLKGVAEQHKIVLELQKQELSYWQQLIDSIAKGGQLGVGPLQQALNSAVETAQRLEEVERESTIQDVRVAKDKEARREHQSFGETVDEITDKIRKQEELQKQVGVENIESYTAIGHVIENYKKELSDVIKLEEQKIKAANAAAAPLAKALTTPTGAFVTEQQKAEREHQAQRAALEQKRREAIATGDDERAKAIKDELEHDTFSRDQRKEQLQRYIANQESLFREPGETGADITRDIGSLGAKKLESAKAELDRIYGAQKAERPGKMGEARGDTETHRLLQSLLDIWR